MKSLSAAHVAFGSEVRRLRQARDWSLEELGHRVGVHHTYIGSVERGERNVSLKNILRIARALETTASGLVQAADDKSL